MTLSQAILFMLIYGSSFLIPANSIALNDPDVCNTLVCQEAAQVLRDFMDTSADPCQDFYQYSCGGWIDKHPIPGDRSDYSITNVMQEQVSARVADLLRNAANEDHIKPIRQAVTLFLGCMDEDARETQGVHPLKNLLNSFGGWPMINPDWSDASYRWQEQVAKVARMLQGNVIIYFGVGPDSRDSSRNIIALGQANLGLARNELLNLTSSERTVGIIEAYKNYIVQSAKLLNPLADEDQLIRDAEEVINFMSALAQFTSPPEERREPSYWYNKMSVANADRITENTYFKWRDFLNIVLQDYPEVTDQTEIIVSDIDFLKNALKIIHATDVRTVANYIGWMLVKCLLGSTTREFKQIRFNYLNVVYGIEKLPKLEDSCSDSVGNLFGLAIGRLYIDKYFTEEAKQDVETIVDDLRSVFELTLNHNAWMDPGTKHAALEKLRAMKSKVAYPPWIRNDQELSDYYSSVPDLKEEEYFESNTKALQGILAITLKRWNEATNKDMWETPPSVVNAFFDPTANTIEFPAGYLVPPQYQYGVPMALNYGGIGMTVGHEITHAFDDTGSQYNKEGNLEDWWSKETRDKFDSKTTCFKKQYSSYVEPITNMKLNGNLTIGDDIADNGGLRTAFLAYQVRAVEEEGQQITTNKRLPGIGATSDQLFFIGYAFSFCSHERKERLQWSIPNSDHTIDRFRVIVPLSNFQEFAEAFSCPLGSPMNPVSKCVLW